MALQIQFKFGMVVTGFQDMPYFKVTLNSMYNIIMLNLSFLFFHRV